MSVAWPHKDDELLVVARLWLDRLNGFIADSDERDIQYQAAVKLHRKTVRFLRMVAPRGTEAVKNGR